MTTVGPASQPTEHQERSSDAQVVTHPRIRRAADVQLTRGIVVGIDGSTSSVDALRWALHEGATRGVEVHVVFCSDMQPLRGFPVVPLDDGAGADREAGSIVSRAMTAVRQLTAGRSPESPVRVDVVEGRPGSLLVDLAADGQLLVVGSRGHGGIVALALGSVGQYCLTHARTTVVVVHAGTSGHETTADTHPDRGIVVGIDGSENSAVALRWALQEGATRGVPIHVVCVWTTPVAIGKSPSLSFGMSDLRAAARATLDETLKSVTALQGPRAANSAITSAVVECDSATEALISASEKAELLVLGSRGHGGFVGLLLGSVSAQCAAHARCSVVVVHNDRDDIVRETASNAELVPSLA